MKQYAVIVAGGTGSRMGGSIPKQFRSLNGRPVLWWSIKAFHDENPDTRVIVVLPQEFISLWKDFYSSLPEKERFENIVVSGGNTRGDSVKNGLSVIDSDDSLVAVHDGARPLVKPATITKGWEVANEKGAAIPSVPVTDSIRKLFTGGSESVDRKDYVAVQTPQVFRTSLLKEAYLKAGDLTFTDDASVAEYAGNKVTLFDGRADNIKITNPKDLAIAAVIMGKDA